MNFVFLSWLLASGIVKGDYAQERARLIEEEATQAIGGDIVLTESEVRVNECLMEFKFKEIDYAFENPQYFNMSYHYFLYRDYIEKSPVYKIIKDMPKGAVLHVHDTGILGPDYLLQLTYLDNLYICQTGSSVQFLFANNGSRDGCDNWQLVSALRSSSSDKDAFDSELGKHFTMLVDNPAEVYPDIKVTWDAFQAYFGTVSGLLTYQPIWDQYFYDCLKKFREQNILYVEVRSVFPLLYELDGTVHDIAVTGITYKKTINRFVSDYPDFVGARVIFAPTRIVEKKQITVYMEEAKQIKKAIGDTLAGFDLVGYENTGNGPLVEFAPELLEGSKDLDFFFHAGETDWYGTVADENLIDAILLGAKRLGHAYALMKHPKLVREVINKGIGLEVNLISNNVLALVSDLRNHPLATFIANGLPVVLSSDDPGVWEADVISHDFYAAFVGVASRLADLRLLKQFAVNSLKYSALESADKMKSLKRFDNQWELFVDNFQCSNY